MADGAPDRRPPLRVVVLGASATVQTSFHGGPRADLAYPRVLERELAAAGHPARVRVEAVPADRIRHAARRVVPSVVAWQPDVVVVHLGQADSVLLVLPRWLERHANSPSGRPHRLRLAYRRRVLRPVWIALAKLQVRVDARVDPTKVRPRQRRIAAELAGLLDHVRRESDALVLVCTLVPPGPPWRNWFPGVGARMEHLNRLFAEVVEGLDDERTRIFPLAELIAGELAPGDEPTPDGGHFTPRAHAVAGAGLASEIVARLEQPRP